MAIQRVERRNLDDATVKGFGQEWAAFDQSDLPEEELYRQFCDFFATFDLDNLGEGFDLGCGSGRWAKFIAPLAKKLHLIDPAEEALEVARKNLAGATNVDFACAGSDNIPLADESQDFGYSIGVLHHIPDTEQAMRDAVRKLKKGGQFGTYLYYRFDNRPLWFRGLWRASDIIRRGVSRLPFGTRKALTTLAAGAVYYPLARTALLLEKAGRDVDGFPLSWYRHREFYSMRTDALDRFGTRLENRFTKNEIRLMMERCGLTDIKFSNRRPYWVASGIKA
jgi:SAM-dependent methyltransferase